MAGPVKNNAQPDIIGQIVPWRHFAIEELKKGSIPFWNPYSFSGNPHLANYQSASLFPLNLLFFLPFDFIDVWGFLVILQPLIAGLSMYVFVRNLKRSPNASLISSFAFMFCGFIVTWMGYATLGYAIIPLPFALYCIDTFNKTKKEKYGIFLSLTFLFSFFAGHFQTSIYFALAVFLYAIYALVISKKRQFKVLLYLCAGILMTMPQVLPSIEFYLHSVRSELFQKMEAIPWKYWTTLFAPDFYGNAVTRNDWFGHYAEWNGYSGTIALVLALFAVFVKRVKESYFFIFLALLSLLLAFDTPLLNLLVYLKIPVLSTSSASRIIVLFSFSIAVLSAFGFDALMENKKKKNLFIFCCSIVAISSLLIASAFILEPDKKLIAIKNSILPIVSLLGVVGFSLITHFLTRKKLLALLAILLVSFAGFEMLRFAVKWQSFDPRNLAYAPVAVSEFYAKQNRFDRVVGMSGGEDSLYYRMPIIIGYDPLYIARYGEFMKFAASGQKISPERSVVTYAYKGEYAKEVLNFLGAKYIVHKVSDGTFPWAFPFADYPVGQFEKIYDDNSYQIFINKSSYPRSYLVNKAVVARDDKELLDGMFSSDLKKVAYVEKETSLSSGSVGSSRIQIYEPNYVKISSSASGSMLLVLTDNFYPGWNVKVNNNPAEILRTDYSFRGVVVPEGESTVEFYYRPNSFFLGVYILLVGVLAIITGLVVNKLLITK